MLLLLRRADTRKFLDRLQRQVAVAFGALLLLSVAAAVIALTTGFEPLTIAALALGLWALIIGSVSDVGSRRLRRVILTIAGLSALAAATGSGFAIASGDGDLVMSGFAVALIVGAATFWIVVLGSASNSGPSVRRRRDRPSFAASSRRH